MLSAHRSLVFPFALLSMVCHRSESVWTTLLGMRWDSWDCPVSWNPWSLWISASSGYSNYSYRNYSFSCCQLLSSLQLLPVSHLTCNSGFPSGLGSIFTSGSGVSERIGLTPAEPVSKLSHSQSALIPIFLPSSKPCEWHYHPHRQLCTCQFSPSS